VYDCTYICTYWNVKFTLLQIFWFFISLGVSWVPANVGVCLCAPPPLPLSLYVRVCAQMRTYTMHIRIHVYIHAHIRTHLCVMSLSMCITGIRECINTSEMRLTLNYSARVWTYVHICIHTRAHLIQSGKDP